VSPAIYLVLELDQPFSGVIQIPSAPLRRALERLGERAAPHRQSLARLVATQPSLWSRQLRGFDLRPARRRARTSSIAPLVAPSSADAGSGTAIASVCNVPAEIAVPFPWTPSTDVVGGD
jgi:hypothetical protein